MIYTRVTILLSDIIKYNGIVDAVWALRGIRDKKRRRKITLEFKIACVEHVLPIYEREYPGDQRQRQSVDVLRAVLANDTNVNRQIATTDVFADYTVDFIASYGAHLTADYTAEREWQREKLIEILNKCDD